MTLLVWTANLLGWPLIHLIAAHAAQRIPEKVFARDYWITAPRRWEADGRLYRATLRITLWKSLLPDGAPWVGGFSKKKIIGRDADYLQRFLCETRRAEMAHWCMFLAAPVFFLWNPLWACWVMALYAIAANLPCILVQRYNRILFARILSRASHRDEK